ncbi:response regulator transcription factor [Larkinella knui]|uniref:DNA-binding response regulator n=1 Tax=Larkinella knui TaxID=2025310 RepID=A0A3P1CU88_9BACT|nr:response regulator transcription factor [Larkinella knui]RRB16831.1 DNA-binding response regulator [Larkinella knui]
MSKILVVDGHSIVRSGIRLLLKDYYGGIQIDEAQNGSTAFRKSMDTDYDLVIMEINLPNTDTFSLLENLRRMAPALPILIFSTVVQYAFVKRYLQMGVKGYLSKQAEDREILLAVQTILTGKKYIDQSFIDQALEDRHVADELDPFKLLSNREFEIAQYLFKGTSVSTIADCLNIHTSTVGTHKARIYDKLRVDNVIMLKDLAELYRLI